MRAEERRACSCADHEMSAEYRPRRVPFVRVPVLWFSAKHWNKLLSRCGGKVLRLTDEISFVLDVKSENMEKLVYSVCCLLGFGRHGSTFRAISHHHHWIACCFDLGVHVAIHRRGWLLCIGAWLVSMLLMVEILSSPCNWALWT